MGNHRTIFLKTGVLRRHIAVSILIVYLIKFDVFLIQLCYKFDVFLSKLFHLLSNSSQSGNQFGQKQSFHCPCNY